MTNDPFSDVNQTAHIRAYFSTMTAMSPACFDVSFTEDETIEVHAADAIDEPWIFEIPSDDDGFYYFTRGDITVKFPYPEGDTDA